MTQSSVHKKIWVTFQRVGFHHFPGAAGVGFEDVSYLSHTHRHLFKFKVSIEVFHDDRELEFHQFLNWLESVLDDRINIDNKSCEMLADILAASIYEKYPGRNFDIEVSEDGECGVTVNYPGIAAHE